MVFIETPSNPWLRTSDIPAISKASHAVGAVFVVDATAATPVLSQPLLLGADIVMHSVTKAINGHSDVIAGVLTCKDAGRPYLGACENCSSWGRGYSVSKFSLVADTGYAHIATA